VESNTAPLTSAREESGAAEPPAGSGNVRILKFGGTSVGDAARIRRAAALVRLAADDSVPVVVVSAVGGVTNLLLEAASLAGRGDEGYSEPLAEIEARHRAILEEVSPPDERPELERRLDEALRELHQLARGAQLLGECTLRTRDRMLAFGELLSAMLVAACLRSDGVPARDVDARTILRTDDRFGSARIDQAVSAEAARLHLPGTDGIPVVTGFIGSTVDGQTTTLGRGASDYTATLLGAMLGAEVVEIWTDVDGVLTADPGAVPEATSVPEIGYEELLELAQFGAKVMCPPAVEPARQAGIPLRIRSTLDPKLPGTLVVRAPSPDPYRPVRGISAIRDVAMIRIEGLEAIGVTEASQRIFRALGVADVESLLFTQDSSAHSVSCAVASDSASRALSALRAEFRRERDGGLLRDPVSEQTFAILAVVGEGMRDTPGVSGRLFSTLGAAKVNIHAIAQGSSERNISWVVGSDQAELALRTAHRTFFRQEGELQPVRVLVLGVGSVGGAFLDQLAEHGEEALAPHGIRPVLVGIARSRKATVDLEGLDPREWRDQVERGEHDPAEAFSQVFTGDPLVVVDCTASAAVAGRYLEYLRAGAAVVTANKVPLSGPLESYLQLRRAAETGGGLHHGTTVGAGLPMVQTVAALRRSGDRVMEMEGVLSGTLTYVFDEVNRGRPFSEAVSEARERGISEPDPREDLRLTDVVRKLVILGREAGFKIEPEDVLVEPILPEALLGASSVEAFMAGLVDLDADFAERSADARARDHRLACVSRIDPSGARVSLETVPAEQPTARILGTENVLVVRSSRYSEHPILIQGPGAGPKVTAAGLMTDLVGAAEQVTHGLRKPVHEP
jgi:aspartokinase/homoserine dehydrogenase 1